MNKKEVLDVFMKRFRQFLCEEGSLKTLKEVLGDELCEELTEEFSRLDKIHSKLCKRINNYRATICRNLKEIEKRIDELLNTPEFDYLLDENCKKILKKMSSDIADMKVFHGLRYCDESESMS